MITRVKTVYGGTVSVDLENNRHSLIALHKKDGSFSGNRIHIDNLVFGHPKRQVEIFPDGSKFYSYKKESV